MMATTSRIEERGAPRPSGTRRRGAAERKDGDLRAELLRMAMGYSRAQVLFAALELGVFEAFDGGEQTAEELARRCGSAAEHTTRLLDACVSTGLLEKVAGHYRNSRLSETFLVEGRSEYMGNWIRFMSDRYGPWGQLAECIRSGKPVEEPAWVSGRTTAAARLLILAMHDYARGPGREIADRLDLAGRRRLLDLGGGAGSYSILLTRKNPELRAVVFDLPWVVEIAREVISDCGASDRVTVQGGDYHVDAVGNGYDVVLLSNMLHQEDPEACKAILRKACDAITDDGLVVVHQAFLNPRKDGPVWATLQALVLLLTYQGGRNYSVAEMLALLREAGLPRADFKRMSLVNAHSMILARKR